MKFISSQYTTCSVGPLIVSGLFGNASMLLPLAKWIWVFCGLKTMPGGRLCVKEPIFEIMRFVWRHDGPTTPIALFGYVTAYQRRSALMRWVLPLCLHHRA